MLSSLQSKVNDRQMTRRSEVLQGQSFATIAGTVLGSRWWRCLVQRGNTHRATFCSNLDPDLDHVNGLNDTGGSHTTETTIQERLGCFPRRAQVFPLKISHLHVGQSVSCDDVWSLAARRYASSTLMARDPGLGPFQQRNCVQVASGGA